MNLHLFIDSLEFLVKNLIIIKKYKMDIFTKNRKRIKYYFEKAAIS